jgi:DNA-binding transcriptional MerR regulator
MPATAPKGLSIGELARRSGCKVLTVRYYEEIGLLPKSDRSDGNQRIFPGSSVERLAFVRHSRDLGFSIDDIRDLLRLSDNPDISCADADSIARRHLAEVEQRLTSLAALKIELERMVVMCRGGSISDCRVIETLSNHALCGGDHPAPVSVGSLSPKT